MKKIISIVGARPNFIKIAPIHKAFLTYSDRFIHKICHTGQHFDRKMSTIFFDELEMPKPDFYLGVGGGSHAEQTAKIMVAFEQILLEEKPDMVIVPGDVNSTLAAGITAAKMHVPVAHVEAGLRSFDMKMPEEINRILTDRISSLLFVTEQSGLENLKKEGFEQDKIFFTGNVMIDSLMFYLNKIDASSILKQHKLDDASYVLATFHRPSNVDSEDALKRIVETVNFLAEHKKVVFPIHPRTRNNLERFDLLPAVHERVLLLEPLGYLDFLKLIKHATLVVTDSGGIQEETTFLGVPCVTVRESTERPVTCEMGTNILAGTDFGKVRGESEKILNGNVKKGEIPPLWDGEASRRIVEIIKNYLS